MQCNIFQDQSPFCKETNGKYTFKLRDLKFVNIKPEETTLLRRPRRRWEDNIRINIREIV
jgi:hypothetical protein